MLRRLEESLLALLLGGMVTLAFLNVLTRYFLRYPLAFTEELLVNGFVWATLLGIAIGLREGPEGPTSASWPSRSFFPLPSAGPSWPWASP
ncbi:TRAP transporter small permease [Thermus scotoductus]|uniref:TRAP transporter small permease n=1 Tax=Thermus scotoductus TaxID=37636 RepID=UPI000691A282|nr:TRAP transporter small permease subunit [Thermus scotoductus]